MNSKSWQARETGAESCVEERSHLNSALSPHHAKELAPFEGSIEPADGKVLSQRAAPPKMQVTESLYPSNCRCQHGYLKKTWCAAQRGTVPSCHRPESWESRWKGRGGLLFYISLGKSEYYLPSIRHSGSKHNSLAVTLSPTEITGIFISSYRSMAIPAHCLCSPLF